MSLSGEALLFLAKASESAERDHEMYQYMKQFVQITDQDLSIEERNLFAVACRLLIGTKRRNLRVLQALQQKEKAYENNHSKLLDDVENQIREEYNSFCEEIIDIISTFIEKHFQETESKFFLLKMKANYYQYLVEYATKEERPELAEKCKKLYQEAYDAAGLRKTNPIRLSSALNYSVYLYEFENDAETAIHIAKTAFDEAISEIDEIGEEEYKDAIVIMQLLRDNITLYMSELEDEGK